MKTQATISENGGEAYLSRVNMPPEFLPTRAEGVRVWDGSNLNLSQHSQDPKTEISDLKATGDCENVQNEVYGFPPGLQAQLASSGAR